MDTKQQQPMEYAVVDKSKKKKKKDDKQQKVNSPLNVSYLFFSVMFCWYLKSSMCVMYTNSKVI